MKDFECRSAGAAVRIMLKLLSQNEVELAAALGRGVRRSVESVTPVDTEHTHHGEVEADAETGRTLDLEGRELFPRIECVAAFEDGEQFHVLFRLIWKLMT